MVICKSMLATKKKGNVHIT